MRHCWVLLVSLLSLSPACAQESGYQVIQGTRVFTQIDHASDTATFSNECGRQTLSHRALGAGAIPSNIIPCPRPGQTSTEPEAPPPQMDAAEIEKNRREGEEFFETGMKRYKAGQWMTASLSFSFAEMSFRSANDTERERQAKTYDAACSCASNFFNAKTVGELKDALSRCQEKYWNSVIKLGFDGIQGQRLLLRAGIPSATPPGVDCSDISGTGTPSPNYSCPGLNWTTTSPVNHLDRPIRLHPARGPDIEIGPGQGLRRAADGSLVVQQPGGGMAFEDMANCRSLGMSLGFLTLNCEIKRQTDLFQNPQATGNDAYNNYMQSTNANSGGRNNGDLNRTKPVTAFRFQYNFGPQPGFRRWTLDAGNHWHEIYPDGHEAKVFDRVTRGSANNCHGAIASQNSEPNLQVFIPDTGCQAMVALFRQGQGAWGTMGAMQDIR